jgi:hypothetical protein
MDLQVRPSGTVHEDGLGSPSYGVEPEQGQNAAVLGRLFVVLGPLLVATDN